MDPIVAVGLLTGRDLERLGTGFRNHFPVPNDNGMFADILAQLDEIDVQPLRHGVVIQPAPKQRY